MAAEIHVKDVLCEAMEYLVKLGSNLRTRSENLKETKIRKDKLTNSLAVQKAADKVLTICELSKRSLANVEAGMRKVLEQLEVSQASSKVGGKSSKSVTDEPKYYYFRYESRVLKLREKISLKHYKSVKVHATKMPLDMLDKYPLYHDCKLYRMRKRRKQAITCDDYLKDTGKEPINDSEKDSLDHLALNKKMDNVLVEVEHEDSNDTVLTAKRNKKKKSTLITSDDSSEDERNSINIAKKELSETKEESCDEPSPKKMKLKSSESKHKSKDNEIVSLDSDHVGNESKERAETKNVSDNESKKSGENEISNNNTMKPTIKCVSLTKLLRPDFIEKTIDPPPLTKDKNKTTVKQLQFDVAKKDKMLKTQKKKKDIIWAQKRKEVSNFKPKEFIINITRLPTMCPEFLHKHKLTKVVQGGKCICEIHEMSDDNSHNPDEELIAEANKVKTSLLCESDSEDMEPLLKQNEKEFETTVDKIKNALLNSDSDQSDGETITTKKKIAKAKEYSSDTNSNKEKNPDKVFKTNEEKKLNKSKNTKYASKNYNSDEDRQSDRASKAHGERDFNRDSNSNKDSDSDKMSITDENKNEKHDNDSNEEAKLDLEQNDTAQDGEIVKNNDADPDNLEEIGNQETINQETPEKESVESVSEPPLDQATPNTSELEKKCQDSAHAKESLLKYSSASDTENEQLKNTSNDTNELLDEENKSEPNKLDEKRRRSRNSSSTSNDILKEVGKKRSHSEKKSISKCRKRIIHDSDDSSDDEDAMSRLHIRKKMVRSKGKPGNCSSHSSDTQDPKDKHIDGLTNLRTLTQSRRRNSDASDQSQSSNSTVKSKMAAPKELLGPEILKAESSSDAPSNDEEEALEEDLSTVTHPGFNGVEHLAKDDLLEESDSSLSNKEAKDDSEEERLNAKRRKANAISSDSEAGVACARARDANSGDVRLSDFEESDDSELARKKTKRNKKGADSDASANSSDGAAKKKRRRIKTIDDSEGSCSDSENEGRNKHGRKNIRKVMGKNQLEEATKKAAREEKERLARIADRQKMYNNVQFDESGKPDEVILDKVVLDFDPETKEPLIAVDGGLVKKLKPHQANGIKFMWDACFESVKRIKKDKGSGCILAHCMGLGKTLQVVTLTHTLLAHDSLTRVHRVLVVCPLSTVLNWVNEFKMWLKHADNNKHIDVYELSRYKQNSERAFQLSQWFEHGGVCVLGYEMFRNLSADNNKKFKKKMLKSFQESLVDPGPDLVVCDEGHLLKNEKTSLSQSMNRVVTLRRIVLTGTPLQNNLKEYYCMVQFVKPNLLGKYNEYLNRFVNPITNGQYTDSTEHDIKIMKRRSHVLHKMLDGAVQRRDYGVLAPFLPPKHEYVLFITLTEVQAKLYQHYLDNYSRQPLPGRSSGFLFPDFQSLQRIWTHPLVLKYNSERYEIMQQKKRDKEEEDESEGSLVDFINDDSTPDESSTEDSTDDSSDMSDDSRKKSKKKKASKKNKGKDKDKESAAASRRRGTRANPIELAEDEDPVEILEVKNDNPTEWWIKMVEEEELEDLRNSHKLILLFDILRQCEAIGDKLLVFSQSLYSLDLIEHFLGKVDEATQEGRIDEKLGGHVGSWSPGVDYFRLDGSTSCENRSIWCKNFNREDNPRARLFLISTRAGGLGINLVAANRVVIFDVSWNPSHDVQSIFRVYRFGQKKPCYVYRFLAMGTMEEKIYERQVTKQAISKRVIDEQQIDRHYAENDLAELYKFEPKPPSPRPLPPLPKDRLFAEMLREHELQIYKYHEHDSLLENKEEETLSEEERKAAWEDFENEKTRPPPPAPFPAPFMHNGMGPGALLQQQYALATLASILRKDMPNIQDHQIRDMLPMLYNTNPSIVQKLFNSYGPQMNMNAMMAAGAGGINASGAGGLGGMGGMGGGSGLQYEPPWQRQQQQQQQMRLHQLMQQQNQMGAKMYAGGLGSRDPVAMALQQQRAREIMMGGGGGGGGGGAGAGAGAGRPRGRPPLQPRAPHPPAGDVVNLDSD